MDKYVACINLINGLKKEDIGKDKLNELIAYMVNDKIILENDFEVYSGYSIESIDMYELIKDTYSIDQIKKVLITYLNKDMDNETIINDMYKNILYFFRLNKTYDYR